MTVQESDFRTLVGLAGDAVTAPIAGSNGLVITPHGGPPLTDSGIGGDRCIRTNFTSQYLEADSLAPRVSAGNSFSFCVPVRCQSTAHPTAPVVCAGKHTTAAASYFQLLMGVTAGVRVFQIVTASSTGVVTRRSGTFDVQFNEFLVCVTTKNAGTGFRLYICDDDGNCFEDPLDIDTFTEVLACDRFGIGALITTGVANVLDGWTQGIRAEDAELSLADFTTWATNWRSTNKVPNRSDGIEWMQTGDSLTADSIGVTYSNGDRALPDIWRVFQRLGINFVGQFVQGSQAQRECCAQGGNSIATIQTHATTFLATANVQFCSVLAGTNNQSSGTTAAALALYLTMMLAIWDAGIARNPLFTLIVWTLPPVRPGTVPNEANTVAFNTGLTQVGGTWDQAQAARPAMVLIRVDGYNCVAPFTAVNFDSGTPAGSNKVHWNQHGVASTVDETAGYQLLIAAGPAIRAASGATLIALSVHLQAPADTSTFVVGDTVVFSGVCSRFPAHIAVKFNGSTIGTAKADTDTVIVGGAITWELAYVLQPSDIGALTVKATITDLIDSSTADSASIGITVGDVAPPGQYLGPYKSLTLVSETTTARTLALADAQSWLRTTNANPVSITVPPNANVAFPIASQVQGMQAGTGQITFVAGAGVTINTPHTLKTNQQWASWCLTKVGADEWDLTGGLAAT